MKREHEGRAKRDDGKPTTKGYAIAPVFLHAFFSRDGIGPLLTYLATVFRDFFGLQFAVKFGFKKIPVINVDHPLDAKVPFTPHRVGVYLDFVAFWIRPLGYIRKRYGRKAGVLYTARFLALVDRCYRDAAQVYRFRMTTTKRPKYYKGKFRIIHLFDPHLLCVPSLHVIVVALAYTFYRVAFEELGMDAEEAKALNEELFAGAVAIGETVLYIKQHSVNCIPAALYALSRVWPEEVTPSNVVEFVNALFAGADDVAPVDAALIRSHIMDMYEELFLEGCHDSDWITPLQRWLNRYPMEGFMR